MSIYRKLLQVLAVVIVGIGCVECTYSGQKEKSLSSDVVVKKAKAAVPTPNLLIVEYGDIPNSVVEEAKNSLTPYFGEVKTTKVALPDSAYYKPRNRYRAKILLNQLLSMVKSNTLVIGLTTKDISTNVHGYDDFGIMGQSYLRQSVAVASTWRIGKVDHLQKGDFKKLMLHELGHSVGLNHCKTANCILHDAERKNRFSYSPSFCEDCQKKLSAKGWRFENIN